MKKIIRILGVMMVVLSLVACSSTQTTDTNPSSSTEDTGTVSNEKTYTIGSIQLVEHVALDQATEGFFAALKDSGLVEGENLTVDKQNAQNDTSNCETIATKFVNNSVDLIFANATPAAQAVAAKTNDIPVVITSVTDPATSGLVNTNDAPGGNITGTSDLTPVEQQVDLLLQLIPDAKKVAIMYCSSEDNSIFQADMAKAAFDKVGIEYVDATVADATSIQAVAESLIGKVDAIYIPTDNLLAENMSAVTQVTNANKIPTIVGEEGMVINGGLATYGINYYNLGYKAGKMAYEILVNGKKPADMPIEYLPAEECSLSINKTTADELGIVIPDDLSNANIVE